MYVRYYSYTVSIRATWLEKYYRVFLNFINY